MYSTLKMLPSQLPRDLKQGSSYTAARWRKILRFKTVKLGYECWRLTTTVVLCLRFEDAQGAAAFSCLAAATYVFSDFLIIFFVLVLALEGMLCESIARKICLTSQNLPKSGYADSKNPNRSMKRYVVTLRTYTLVHSASYMPRLAS